MIHVSIDRQSQYRFEENDGNFLFHFGWLQNQNLIALGANVVGIPHIRDHGVHTITFFGDDIARQYMSSIQVPAESRHFNGTLTRLFPGRVIEMHFIVSQQARRAVFRGTTPDQIINQVLHGITYRGTGQPRIIFRSH